MIEDFSRHNELFDPSTFSESVTVIGVGATGSWLVLALTRLGISNITVYDYDIVEEHNIPNQAYSFKQIGMPKVEALKTRVMEDTGIEIQARNTKYEQQPLSGYVFCMVDSMETRKNIWLKTVKLKPSIKHYIEPRMGLELGRVYNVNPMKIAEIKEYEKTLYGDENAEVSACGTSLTVVSSAMHIAAICTRQLISVANEKETTNEIIVDMAYNNMLISDWK